MTNVVVATTKVHIFKQITTEVGPALMNVGLLLLPQRYIFSSKSQPPIRHYNTLVSCCCYHKGTYFQANHNMCVYHTFITLLLLLPQRYIFSSKSQLKITPNYVFKSCCCYHKGTYFQANHNLGTFIFLFFLVVVATTKVHIFKQITTVCFVRRNINRLLLLPQRYIFSSKSQLFQIQLMNSYVVVATTKLLQKSEMRKDIVIELSYKGFSCASDYS